VNTQPSLSGWANYGDSMKYDWREMIPDLDKKAKLLQVLSPDQLRRRWVAAGSHTLSDYGFTWVHIEGTLGWDGVSFINDVRQRKQFQIEVADRLLKIDKTTETVKYWEMIAVLVAKFAGLQPLHEVSHPPAPFPPREMPPKAPYKRKKR
jgi:hypothetical protein